MVARCPICGAFLRLVHVHGHGQCAACGSNVEPCCTGVGNEADETCGAEISVVPEVFARLFASLGASHASVGEEALLNALAMHQGCTIDDARLLLEAGLHVGTLARAGVNCWRLAAKGRAG